MWAVKKFGDSKRVIERCWNPLKENPMILLTTFTSFKNLIWLTYDFKILGKYQRQHTEVCDKFTTDISYNGAPKMHSYSQDLEKDELH